MGVGVGAKWVPYEVPIVGPYVVLPKLKGSRLWPRSKVYKVIMRFLGLIWALGRKSVSLSGLEVQKFWILRG